MSTSRHAAISIGGCVSFHRRPGLRTGSEFAMRVRPTGLVRGRAKPLRWYAAVGHVGRSSPRLAAPARASEPGEAPTVTTKSAES